MHRRFCMKAGAGILFIIAALSSTGTCPGQNAAEGPADPLPSWNEGAAKKAIVYVREPRHDRGRPGIRAGERADRHF